MFFPGSNGTESSNDRLYNVLNIDKKADDEVIRKAYRQLARRWHPDNAKSQVLKRSLKRSVKLMVYYLTRRGEICMIASVKII